MTTTTKKASQALADMYSYEEYKDLLVKDGVLDKQVYESILRNLERDVRSHAGKVAFFAANAIMSGDDVETELQGLRHTAEVNKNSDDPEWSV